MFVRASAETGCASVPAKRNVSTANPPPGDSVHTHTTACCPFPGTCLLPMTPPSVLFAVRVLAFSPPLWL